MPRPDSEEILLPSKRKWILMLLVCAVFVAGGFLMLNHPDKTSDRFWGYVSIAFFGLGVVVSAIQLMPGSSFLRLNAEGLTFRTMWSTKFYRWSDIERFGVAEFTTFHGAVPQRHRRVGMDFSASFPRRDKARAMKELARSLTGFEGALPDNYGWKHAELAAHLNELRERYLSSSDGRKVGR